MITYNFLKYFAKIINLAASWSATTLKYDLKLGLLQVRKLKRYQYFILNFTLLTHVTYGIYDLARLVLAFRSNSRDFYGMMIMLVWGLVYLWGVIAMSNFRCRGDEMVYTFNQLVWFDKGMEGEFKGVQFIPQHLHL